MRQGRWHVFHFIGHGGFDQTADEGIIALADDQGGTRSLHAGDLSLLLRDHASLRLVLLNACDTGRAGALNPFSSTAGALVRQGIPAVVAMQYEVSDRAAIEFARTFYAAIADELPIDVSVMEARRAVKLAHVELQIRSGLSVPVQLGGGTIGTLDVYSAAPGGWDATEISALQTYAGLVATLLGTAAKAERRGRLAEQLQVALDARNLIEQAKGALMDRERLDDQEAFSDLRQAARSSRREPPEGAGGKVISLPLPHGRDKPAGTADGRAPLLDMGALDGDVAAFLGHEPGADGIGHKLSQLLLGFLATEVVPLANRLAELGTDPTPLFATTSGILRLYADTLDRPDLRR
jgi:GAF domain-containing protein